MGRVIDLGDSSSLKARQDTTALMIGMLFKQGTGSNELMMETMHAVGDDVERLQGMVGTLLNFLYAYVTISGTDPTRWQTLVDHLCETLDVSPN